MAETACQRCGAEHGEAIDMTVTHTGVGPRAASFHELFHKVRLCEACQGGLHERITDFAMRGKD